MIWIATIISSILYRVGGAGSEEIKWANSQYRDTGIPILLMLYLTFSVGVTWYIALAVSCLVCGFIRTYWDFITGNDNLWLHGIGIGASFIPLAWDGVSCLAIGLYTITLVVFMGGVNWLCNRFNIPYAVWIEELSRGAVIFLAIPLLFLARV